MVNSNLLRGKIVANGMSQKELAIKMRMSENTLSSKIRGTSMFTIDEVERICDLLHIQNPIEKCEIFLAESSQ